MASAESNDEDMILHLKRSGELSELGFTSTHFVSNANHEVLIDKLRNVALEAESNAVKESGNNSISFPLRPYAEDCPYYSRTGTCKFGFNCRFNHPVKKSNRVSKAGKAKQNVNNWSSMNDEKILCKYYLTPGGCKYRDSCKFIHAKVETGTAVPELNFAGLPIRVGRKECPYYMRCGSCGYGTRCVFNHPEPTSTGGFDSLKSNSGYSLGSSSNELASQLLTGSSQLDQAPWASYPVSSHFPYQDDQLTYMSMNSVAQGVPYQDDQLTYMSMNSVAQGGPYQDDNLNYMAMNSVAQVVPYQDDNLNYMAMNSVAQVVPYQNDNLNYITMNSVAQAVPYQDDNLPYMGMNSVAQAVPYQDDNLPYMGMNSVAQAVPYQDDNLTYMGMNSVAQAVPYQDDNLTYMGMNSVAQAVPYPDDNLNFMAMNSVAQAVPYKDDNITYMTMNSVAQAVPYKDDNITYVTMNSVAQGVQKHFDWNEYQASETTQERSSQAYMYPGARADVLKSEISVQDDEFPERPGQPVCSYFLRTGDCKYKSACRFHHPKDWVRKTDTCALSEKGLPLRPGKTVCKHYECFGICKFGRACMFDHPINPKLAGSSSGKPRTN